jgi:hypothetical protein
MVETAAHLADHVLPRLPVRQWALSVPKRPRDHLDEAADRQGLERLLRNSRSPGLRAGALA